MRVLVVANRADPEPGYVGDALVERGYRLDMVWREQDEPLPDPTAADLVLALGSDWSVYWEHVAPQVDRELQLLRAATGAQVPVLGLCFGGQVLARALGGRVEPSAVPELGWFTIETDLPELLPSGPWLQWHVDRFSVPPGAFELARSPAGPQAFALGSAVGLQFHPEATPGIVGRWAREAGDTLERHGTTAAALVAACEREAPRARHRADRLVSAFLRGQLRPTPVQ